MKDKSGQHLGLAKRPEHVTFSHWACFLPVKGGLVHLEDPAPREAGSLRAQGPGWTCSWLQFLPLLPGQTQAVWAWVPGNADIWSLWEPVMG